MVNPGESSSASSTGKRPVSPQEIMTPFVEGGGSENADEEMIATDGLPDSTERAATLAAQREKETLLQKKGLWHKQKLIIRTRIRTRILN